jgi:hypothetical protein
MKSTLFRVAILLLGVFTLTLTADVKRYEVKSGIIEYTISGGGSMMGVTSKEAGDMKLSFKEYGNLERQEVHSTSTTMGQVDKTDELHIFKDGIFYIIDHEQKVIVEHTPEALKEMTGQDMGQMGKDMMEKMGGKKVGNGEVLGYDCEIWELMGTKTWIYKGVPLKTEANIMGFNHTQVATSAKFGVSVSDSEFDLPKYEKKTLNQVIQEESGGAENMPSPEEMQQMQEMMKKMMESMGQQ